MARIVLLAGALGSVAFLFHATGEGAGAVLRLLMASWVVAPFLAIEIGQRIWPRKFRNLAIAVTVAALALCLADAVKPFSPKAAFAFVMVPMGAWAAIVITGAAAWSASRKR